MSDISANKIFGLDLMRSIAILIVVTGHSLGLISKYTDFPFVPLPDGVDLFFVLSGYLIGTIIIKTIEQNQKFDMLIALNFLQRRWFRTLPNYFLFLLINIILVYWGVISGSLNKFLITYFFFFQNFYEHYDFLFWESWSLAVEEWFYLLLPLTLLFLYKMSKSKMKAKFIILTAITSFLIFPLIYRILHVNPSMDFDLYVRKLVLPRLDTIGFGLLAAFIHWYYRDFWRKSKNLFFILGLAMIIFFLNIDIQNIYFFQTFYYSFISLSIFLLLPKLESFKNENIPLKPFRFISKISYSMYLIHLPLAQIINRTFTVSNKVESFMVYMFFWLLTFILSYAVYALYERPMMNLRDKVNITAFRKHSNDLR